MSSRGKATLTPFPYEELDNREEDHWSGAQLDDDRLRALALGAFYSARWDAFHDGLLLGPEREHPLGDRRELAIDTLTGAWGITDGTEAQASMEQLLKGMHAPLYALVHPLVTAALTAGERDRFGERADRHRAFLRQVAAFRGMENPEALVRDYDIWCQAIKIGFTSHLARPVATCIHAWDLARVTAVARMAFTAGYLEADVAWSYMARALPLAQRKYRNWRQFGDAYLAGWTYWQACEDLAVLKDGGVDRRMELLRLWTRPTSPWRRVALHPRPEPQDAAVGE
ncbi:DUF1266 domain-containing protein [Nocardia sp. NPDC050697]|uniref:DUF1266 domain-containing protein n=1 Tax=Nocardia sp. NPDC050697 TaxID=3155158 RepID=UPI0033FF09DD